MPHRDFAWGDLRFLLAAARAGTLAGAARALGVEHTTVGRRLEALERALGGALFVRKPDGLTLTALGERVLPIAQETEQLMLRLVETAGSEQTRVRLALPSGFASFFASRLHTLRDAHPPLALELISGAQPVDLRKGEADLALRIGPITDADLVARRLGTVGWALYASPLYLARKPVATDPLALDGHDLVGYDASLAHTPAARWLDDHAAGAVVTMRGRELTDVCSAAASGAGLALLPCFLAAAQSLVRVQRDLAVTRDLWLVYRREVRASAAVKKALAFVIATVEEARDVIAGAAT